MHEMILMQETLLPYRAALHRPVVEAAEVRDDLDAGDTAPYRAALHRPDVEAAEVGECRRRISD